MAPTERELVMAVLRACFDAAPEPLYPAAFTEQRGLSTALLDRVLDQLRLKGLVRLTEWVQDAGQGYTLTQAGLDLLQDPRGLRPGAPLPAAPPPAMAQDLDAPEPPPVPLFRSGPPVVCISLIAVNVLIFIAQSAGLAIGPLFVFLAPLSANDVLRNGEWRRIITHAFLHADIIHIGCNMYFLYSLGPLLEAMWGSSRFLLLYFVAAITGGCMVVWVGRGAPTVGASGALCGLLGSLAVWALLNREHLPPEVAQSLLRTAMINLVIVGVISFYIPNVSWEGHLGGAVGGALASFPLQLSRYGGTWPRRAVGLLGTLLVAAVFIALTAGRNWGIAPAL